MKGKFPPPFPAVKIKPASHRLRVLRVDRDTSADLTVKSTAGTHTSGSQLVERFQAGTGISNEDE